MKYHVSGWADRYENNRSRKVKDLAWVPIPNKHDGESYSRLIAGKNAAEIFAAWILILQVASRCHPRGSLVRSDGTPHSSESLSVKTRAPKTWFDRALPYLVEIGWLKSEAYEQASLALDCHHAATTLPPDRRRGDEEGKGIEENGMEPAPLPASLDTEAFQKAWGQFRTHRQQIKKKLTPMAETMALKEMVAIGEPRAIRAIEHTIAKGWQGIREPDLATNGNARNSSLPVTVRLGENLR